MTIEQSDPRRQRLRGVFALLLTPFQPDGAIDWSCYDQYVAWQLACEPHGLFAVCGSSEMKWLTLDERLALARRAVELAGDTPVVATANLEPDPASHLDEIQRMADTGISAVVLTPVDGLGAEPERLCAYLAALAEQAPCPVLLYEWPQVQRHRISPECYAQLVQQQGVWGIKDTTCTLEGIRAKIEVAGDSTVFQANTPLLLAALRIGAGGVMAITSTAAADLVVACWRQALSPDEQANQLHGQLVFLDSLLRFAYPATAKWLAAQRGLPMSTQCRAPAALPEEAIQALTVWLRDLNAAGSVKVRPVLA